MKATVKLLVMWKGEKNVTQRDRQQTGPSTQHTRVCESSRNPSFTGLVDLTIEGYFTELIILL